MRDPSGPASSHAGEAAEEDRKRAAELAALRLSVDQEPAIVFAAQLRSAAHPLPHASWPLHRRATR